MRTIQKNKGLLAILAFCMLLAACIHITSQFSVDAASSSANYSFPTMTEAATQYLNQMSKPQRNLSDEIKTSFTFGKAGGLLGYEDSEVNDKESSFIVTSTSSNNAVEYDYGALAGIRITNVSWSPPNGMPAQYASEYASYMAEKTGATFSQYAYFGTALNQLGFDEVSVNGSNDSSRMIMGIIMMGAYIMSMGLTMFFDMIFTLLDLANPFRLFANATALASSMASSQLTASATEVTFKEVMLNSVVNVADAFSSVYDVLHSLSLGVILPLTCAVCIFTWLILRKGTGFWQTWKGFFVKVAFACIGVPFMFACYSTSLDMCRDLVCNKIDGSKIVTSTFCDFETWVLVNSLRLPENYTIEFDTSSYSLRDETVLSTRNMCAAINAESGAAPNAKLTNFIFNGETYTTSSNSFQAYDRYFLNYAIKKPSSGGYTIKTEEFADTIAILQKYARGDKISATAYEAAVKAGLDDNEAYVAMCQLSSHWTYFVYDNASEVTLQDVAGDVTLTEAYVSNSTLYRWTSPEWVYNTWPSGSIKVNNIWADDGGNMASKFTVTYGAAPNAVTHYCVKFQRKDDDRKGLSTMSMYNYLSTDFQANKMIVYSSLNAANDQVKVEHYAVNLVGTGLLRVIYFLDALVLLSCMSVIGYGYGLAIIFGNFKAMFKLLPAMFTGMLGNMRGIATALAITAALICEVLVTMLLYAVACDLIILIYELIEIPLGVLLTSDSGIKTILGNTISGVVITPLLGIISIALIVTITKKLLEWRHAVVQSTVDVCTSMINKFLGTQISSPDLDAKAGTIGGKLANAASIATGLAMGMGGLTDNEGYQNIKDEANKAKDGLTDKLLGKNGDTDVENMFGVKEGNGTGMDENGNVVGKNSSLVESGKTESEKAGEDGVFDARGKNLDAAAEEYVKQNEESGQLGNNEESSVNPLVAASAGAATGVAASSASSGGTGASAGKAGSSSKKSSLADKKAGPSDSKSEVTSADGSQEDVRTGDTSLKDDYDYYKSIDTDDAGAIQAYEEADLADDGVRNNSADTESVLGSYNQNKAVNENKGGGFNRGRVNPRPHASEEYKQQYDDSYLEADWTDDGELNESATKGGTDSKGRTMAATGRSAASKAYTQNYSQDYAQADYADDGQYNGSVESSVTEEYAQADLADDGQYNGSASAGNAGRFTTSGNKASAAYNQNHTQEYANADVTDDGKYNGSVAGSVNQRGKMNVRPNAGPSKAYTQNYSQEYAQADYADNGQYDGSVDVGGVNDAGQYVSTGQPSGAYQQKYTEQYQQADYVDDGQYNGSVAGTVPAGGGRVNVRPNSGPSKAYTQNYTQEYAQADYADDGQYNGSVQAGEPNSAGKRVVVNQPSQAYRQKYTEQYVQADYADDGQYNGSVEVVTTGGSNGQPNRAYTQNYTPEYAQADYADDGQYNGSVQSVVQSSHTGSTGQPKVVQRTAGGAYKNNVTEVYVDDAQQSGTTETIVNHTSGNEHNMNVQRDVVQQGGNNAGNVEHVTEYVDNGSSQQTSNFDSKSFVAGTVAGAAASATASHVTQKTVVNHGSNNVQNVVDHVTEHVGGNSTMEYVETETVVNNMVNDSNNGSKAGSSSKHSVSNNSNGGSAATDYVTEHTTVVNENSGKGNNRVTEHTVVNKTGGGSGATEYVHETVVNTVSGNSKVSHTTEQTVINNTTGGGSTAHEYRTSTVGNNSVPSGKNETVVTESVSKRYGGSGSGSTTTYRHTDREFVDSVETNTVVNETTHVVEENVTHNSEVVDSEKTETITKGKGSAGRPVSHGLFGNKKDNKPSKK